MLQGNDNSLYRNGEGYPDPTACAGIKAVMQEQTDADKRAHELVKVLKYITRLAGFELTDRIKIKDLKTGREYK